MKKDWLEKDFDKKRKEKTNLKKCPNCGKYLDYEKIGYMRYGFICNNLSCNNQLNRNI